MMKSDPLGFSVFLAIFALIGAWIYCIATVTPMITPAFEEVGFFAKPTQQAEVIPATLAPAPENAAVLSGEDEKNDHEAPNEPSRLAKIGWERFIGFVVISVGVILLLISRGDITPRNFT